ncbi:MAG: NAD(P)-dependent oxidoreductase, partial [Sphingopyxis granuli]
VPAPLLHAGGRLDMLVRRHRAKLTADRARYIAHPDWVAAEGACPPPDLWRPAVDTADALAETVRWYRQEGWL